MTKLSKALTWDDLAEAYNKCNGGRKAMTLPMNQVFEWAERQSDKFEVNKEEGSIHKILK